MGQSQALDYTIMQCQNPNLNLVSIQAHYYFKSVDNFSCEYEWRVAGADGTKAVEFLKIDFESYSEMHSG